MGNKFTAKLAGICISGLLLTIPMNAFADTNTSSLLNQKSDLVQQKQQMKSELDKLKAQMDDLTGKVSNAQIEVGKTQDEVAQLNKNIVETKKRIESRQDLLKQRMKAAYINGGSSVNVLEVLMGSKSFGDFINRAVAIYNITDHDNNIIKKQVADQNLLENQKAKVKQDLADSQAKLKELNQLVAKIETIQSQKQTALSGINSKEKQINSELSTQYTSKKSTVVASRPSSSNGITQMSYIPSNVASGTVSDILSASRQYIGHSNYVFGAMDPANGRFDCSGFVNWAYQQIGINLGSRSTSGLQYVGHSVSKGDLQPGDLVFFDTYKHNGHVAVYLGNGQFLGSQTSTGVAIESINDPYYWGPRYSMARRVF